MALRMKHACFSVIPPHAAPRGAVVCEPHEPFRSRGFKNGREQPGRRSALQACKRLAAREERGVVGPSGHNPCDLLSVLRYARAARPRTIARLRKQPARRTLRAPTPIQILT